MTPKQIFDQVRWYGYDPADGTLLHQVDIPRNFKASCWRYKRGAKPDNSKRRERRTSN